MYLREATPEDIDELFANLREEDAKAIERMGSFNEARNVVDQLLGHFTHQLFMTEDHRVAGLWIGVQKYRGVVEIVGYTTTAAEDERIGFFRASQRGIAAIKEVMGAHKIECIVWDGYDKSIKWLQRLGFEIEGYSRQHGPDKSDATLMGRIF